jgi:hypothetical protein
MPRHDDKHAPSDVDAAITAVLFIVLVAVVLLLAGATRPYMLGQIMTPTEVTVPVVPPM